MEKNVVLKPQGLMDARQLVIAGLLVGITVFLGLSGYGFIPLFTINATILHVPTIIGAIVAGPKVGCMVGFFFGLFSFGAKIRSSACLLRPNFDGLAHAIGFLCVLLSVEFVINQR